MLTGNSAGNQTILLMSPQHGQLLFELCAELSASAISTTQLGIVNCPMVKLKAIKPQSASFGTAYVLRSVQLPFQPDKMAWQILLRRPFRPFAHCLGCKTGPTISFLIDTMSKVKLAETDTP